MTAYTFQWNWTLDQDCTARASGNPFILDRSQWGSFDPVRLEFGIPSTSPCSSWTTVDFRQVDGPGGASLLQKPVRVTRGQASDCNSAKFDAQCANVNTRAENGLYTFEAAVYASGQTRRSTAQVRLRD